MDVGSVRVGDDEDEGKEVKGRKWVDNGKGEYGQGFDFIRTAQNGEAGSVAVIQ